MKSKFLGFLASLVLLGSTQAHSSTLYVFDTPVSGTIAPAGTVELSVNASLATFTVELPSDYTFTKFALNLDPGATVAPGAGYTVVANAHASFNQGALNYGPFNTVLNAHSGGNFGNSLAFTVSNYTGIFDEIIGGKPIWFVAAFVHSGGLSGVMASDAVQPPPATPLPGALPLFGSGLGALGILGWRFRRKKVA